MASLATEGRQESGRDIYRGAVWPLHRNRLEGCAQELEVMKVRKAQRVAVVILLAGATTSIAQQYEFPFQNPSLPLEQRADDVVSRMTPQENLAAFANPAVKRLNIPGLRKRERYPPSGAASRARAAE